MATLASAVTVAGIDLGTTNSVLHLYLTEAGKATRVQFEGNDTMPSFVTYIKSSDENNNVEYLPILGHEAVRAKRREPSYQSFSRIKTSMGLSKKEMDLIKDKMPYEVEIEEKNGQSTVYLLHKEEVEKGKQVIRGRYTPIQLSAYILDAIASTAKVFASHSALGRIEGAVVTVPAYFTQNQCDATRLSAKILQNSFDINSPPTIMNEPVAAAFAYQFKQKGDKQDKFLVFDIGGGTLDCSVVEYEEGVLEVKAYSGNNFLGGENVNDLLYAKFSKLVMDKTGLKEIDFKSEGRLRAFVEDFKIALCTKQNESGVDLNENVVGQEHQADFFVDETKFVNVKMTYSEFKTLCQPVINGIKDALTGANGGIASEYKKRAFGDINTITKVLMVGGSSRLPFVRELLAGLYGKSKLDYSLDPDMCVSEGAALYAAHIAGLLGEQDLICMDMVNMDIGIAVEHNQFEQILVTGTAVPAKTTKIFTTAVDNQTKVSIKVAQGLSPLFHENKYLGQFDLEIKKPAPRGIPQIEVTVSMDTDRKIVVTAIDKHTNVSCEAVFKRSDHSLSEAEINKIRADKEANKERYAKIRENYDARKELENYMESVKQRASALTGASKAKIDNALNEVNNWLRVEQDGADKGVFFEKLEGLKNTCEECFKTKEETAPREEL